MNKHGAIKKNVMKRTHGILNPAVCVIIWNEKHAKVEFILHEFCFDVIRYFRLIIAAKAVIPLSSYLGYGTMARSPYSVAKLGIFSFLITTVP